MPADVAQNRYEQAVLGVDRDAEIRLLVQAANLLLRILPDIEGKLGGTGGGDGTHDAHGDIATVDPDLDVGSVAHGRRHDLA